jgi:hypothetical protein
MFFRDKATSDLAGLPGGAASAQAAEAPDTRLTITEAEQVLGLVNQKLAERDGGNDARIISEAYTMLAAVLDPNANPMRPEARATVGEEFPTCTLSVVQRVPSFTLVHVSASPPTIPDGRISRVWF